MSYQASPVLSLVREGKQSDWWLEAGPLGSDLDQVRSGAAPVIKSWLFYKETKTDQIHIHPSTLQFPVSCHMTPQAILDFVSKEANPWCNPSTVPSRTVNQSTVLTSFLCNFLSLWCCLTGNGKQTDTDGKVPLTEETSVKYSSEAFYTFSFLPAPLWLLVQPAMLGSHFAFHTQPC